MSDNQHDDFYDDDEEIIYVSKSELKRDAQELKDLGVRLAELKPSQLDELHHDRLYVSKSELKRDAQELKDLGVRLAELKPSQLDELQLHDRLRQAVDECHRIKSHNARKRHFGFIGKLTTASETCRIRILNRSRRCLSV